MQSCNLVLNLFRNLLCVKLKDAETQMFIHKLGISSICKHTCTFVFTCICQVMNMHRV